MSIFIPSEKYTKSDVQKTWNGIFIGYIGISKHLKVWVPCTYQVLITSEPIINKIKKDVNLLLKDPLMLDKPLQP